MYTGGGRPRGPSKIHVHGQSVCDLCLDCWICDSFLLGLGVESCCMGLECVVLKILCLCRPGQRPFCQLCVTTLGFFLLTAAAHQMHEHYWPGMVCDVIGCG